MIKNLTEEGDSDDFGENMDLHVSVLQGIWALAKSAPLKVRIVDRVLPYVIRAKNSRDHTSVSNSASQAFQSLEFADDEVAVQTAGNHANLLSDWFCMQQSFVIQAMARAISVNAMPFFQLYFSRRDVLPTIGYRACKGCGK
jgi:hypothetical protein